MTTATDGAAGRADLGTAKVWLEAQASGMKRAEHSVRVAQVLWACPDAGLPVTEAFEAQVAWLAVPPHSRSSS